MDGGTPIPHRFSRHMVGGKSPCCRRTGNKVSFYELCRHTGMDDLTLPRFINIHLLSLLDGSPHEIPLKSVLTLDLGHNHNPAVIEMRISGSRIALVIQVSSFPLGGRHKELIAWDWKTGEVVSDFTSWEIRFTTLIQVLKHLSDNPDMGDAIETIATMCFLEDSWLLVLSRGSPVARLLVFNTLLSQQDSRGWRILDLPLPGLQGYYFISTQYEKPLAEFPEFSVDPAQRFFVVFCMHKVALVTPVELLVRYVYSVRTSPCIPWTEWGEDVITVNLHPGTSQLRVFDTKVLALRTSCVEMFDLSASCRRDVQAQQVGERAGGRCERVLSTPKWSFRYPLGDGISYTTRLVGDSVVCFFVSPLSAQKVHASYSMLRHTGAVVTPCWNISATHL